MEQEHEEQKTEHGNSETPQSRETRPTAKPRDLKPEKDPMGAGKKIAPQAGSLEGL